MKYKHKSKLIIKKKEMRKRERKTETLYDIMR